MGLRDFLRAQAPRRRLRRRAVGSTHDRTRARRRGHAARPPSRLRQRRRPRRAHVAATTRRRRSADTGAASNDSRRRGFEGGRRDFGGDGGPPWRTPRAAGAPAGGGHPAPADFAGGAEASAWTRSTEASGSRRPRPARSSTTRRLVHPRPRRRRRWERDADLGTWCGLGAADAPVHAVRDRRRTCSCPASPTGVPRREPAQEGFLVLSGECIAIVEGEERRMRQWDYLHCPPGRHHITVGAGDGPCVILMVGTRGPGGRRPSTRSMSSPPATARRSRATPTRPRRPTRRSRARATPRSRAPWPPRD